MVNGNGNGKNNRIILLIGGAIAVSVLVTAYMHRESKEWNNECHDAIRIEMRTNHDHVIEQLRLIREDTKYLRDRKN